MKIASCSSEPSSQKMSDFRDMRVLQVRRTWGRLLALVDLSKVTRLVMVLICNLNGSEQNIQSNRLQTRWLKQDTKLLNIQLPSQA